MCDPVLRRSDNTAMDYLMTFFCMPSLEKATVREEPHELGTSILSRVADHTTPPAPAGTAIPRASPEGDLCLPDLNRKLSVEKKVSRAGSSGLAAGDEIEQTDDGTLADDDQRDGLEFAMEDIGNLNDVGQDMEVEDSCCAFGRRGGLPRQVLTGMHFLLLRRACKLFLCGGMPQPLDTGAGADEGSSSVLPGRFTSDPYEENDGCESPPYTKDDWDEIHGVNLGLRKKELYKDPQGLITIKKQTAELKQHKESAARASEEVSGLKAELGALKSKFLKSSEFNRAFAGVLNTAISVGVERGLRMGRTDEEFRGLSQRVTGFIPDAKEKFDRVIAAFPDATFPFLDKVSQHSQSSLQDIARLEPDRVTPSSQPSSVTASLRTSTHARHSTSSSGTFGHTSTPEHLKKKKKPVERGGPSAA
ncbi:hypothetical protein Tco_1457009 [Tanacetum coccineum]